MFIANENMLSLKQLKLRFLVLFVQIWPSLEHARLMEPPSRASMWRLGFPTPVDQVRCRFNKSYCTNKIYFNILFMSSESF